MIAKALEHNKKIKELYLGTLCFLLIGNNQIEDSGAEAISKVVEKSSSLAQLQISEAKIDVKGSTAIAIALKNKPNITHLYLSNLVYKSLDNNKIGDDACIIIASILEAKSNIKELYIDNTEIGDKGAEAIAKALETNTSLEKLYLDKNLIKNAGAVAIAKALKVNKKLNELHLGTNNIEDEGAISLANSITTNTTLSELYIGMVFIVIVECNKMKESGKKALSKVKEISKKFYVWM